jgi:hypothetical protein
MAGRVFLTGSGCRACRGALSSVVTPSRVNQSDEVGHARVDVALRVSIVCVPIWLTRPHGHFTDSL